LQAFFTDRLTRQRHASPQTVAAYRDTWRLLLTFTARRTGKQPAQLDLGDLDAPLIGDFLGHLERDRGNGPRTRNARLAAIHSMFSYAALQHPEHAQMIARVLAIPPKRFDKALVTYLTEDELDALLAAPDKTTWAGRRDHAMILLAAQAGLRISELTGLACGDVHLGTGPHVSCHGKGRKQRITPLIKVTVAVLRAWLAERAGQPGQPLFPNRTGAPLSRDAVEKRLARHVAAATGNCPALTTKNVTAHTLRHTAAMRLQGCGVVSDATFRGWREGGVAGPAALPGVRRACGRAAGHAVDQGFLAAGCGGCQDVASESVALDDRWLHLASRVEGAVWGQRGGRWRWWLPMARCRFRPVPRCWRRCWPGGAVSSRRAG
jgi:integrase